MNYRRIRRKTKMPEQDPDKQDHGNPQGYPE